MPWRFAQPLAAQCNGVSKTAADCNNDLNSLPGTCPTYLARKLRPATKSVNTILFNQNESRFTHCELKEGPQADWSRQSKMCHEHRPFTCSSCSAVASLLSPLLATAPYYKCFACSKGPHYSYDLSLECYSSTSWLKLEINLTRTGPKGKICILHKACCKPCCPCPLWLAQGWCPQTLWGGTDS